VQSFIFSALKLQLLSDVLLQWELKTSVALMRRNMEASDAEGFPDASDLPPQN
jgi:hypothetical protein